MGQRYLHPEYGECEYLRAEGIYWIVRFAGSPHEQRLGPSDRQNLTPLINVGPGSNPQSQSTGAGPRPQISQRPAASSPPASGGSRWGLGAILGRLGIPLGRQASPSIPTWMTPAPVPTDAPPIPDVGQSSAPHRPPHVQPSDDESRRLRHAFESLRTGLSPVTASLRPLAIGAEVIEQHASEFFERVDEGGSSVVFRGGYGLGKTFNLHLLRELALEQNFCVMLAEIDSGRNQLHKPASVLRSLIQSLRFPHHDGTGAIELVRQVHTKLKQQFNHEQYLEVNSHYWPWGLAMIQKDYLADELECVPLSWLFSDPTLPEKESLVDLLACDPQGPLQRIRDGHALPFLAIRDQWPAFRYGTQGDFGSYLLSGMGKACRWLGYRGLIVLLDEMEKWENLNWKEQGRAGNLLGGLLWSASAPDGERDCSEDRYSCAHPPELQHSARGGHPFTTPSPCHLGLGIALTPRGEEGPEADWAAYGNFETIDLPQFTATGLNEYFMKVYPLYCRAYGLSQHSPAELIQQAQQTWFRNPDRSTRMGVRAVMAALDEWRERVVDGR